MKSHNKISKIKIAEEEKERPIVKKKTSYIIPEILKDTFNSDNIQSIESRLPTNATSQQQTIQQMQQLQEPLQPTNYVIPPQQQSLLPEALNPMNLINNSSTTTTSNYNPNPHSTSSLLMPSLPPHEPAPIPEHQIHHFSNFDNTTTYLPPTPNILSNSFNFMIGSLDFSKNNLNGEPTYIDY